MEKRTPHPRLTIPMPLLFAVCLVAAGPCAAAAEEDEWTLPRTPDGQPDISGVWDFRTLTPLERPQNTADKSVLSAEEAAEAENRAVARAAEADKPSNHTGELLPEGGNVGGYNNYWFDRGAKVVGDRRTSLIVDPPDGRLPPLQDGVKTQVPNDDAESDRPVRLKVGGIGLDGPEDRGLAERCLLGFNSGPPIRPGGYNQNVQIFQADGVVALLNEMVHDARIIPIDGSPQLPDHIRQWKGSSRGRWEGETLVVETTHVSPLVGSFSPSPFAARGSAEKLHLIERFTRVDDATLLYEFTVDDPTTYTRPFTVQLPMQKSDLPIYEYACHEGNYGLRNSLSGARAAERAAAQSSGDAH